MQSAASRLAARARAWICPGVLWRSLLVAEAADEERPEHGCVRYGAVTVRVRCRFTAKRLFYVIQLNPANSVRTPMDSASTGLAGGTSEIVHGRRASSGALACSAFLQLLRTIFIMTTMRTTIPTTTTILTALSTQMTTSPVRCRTYSRVLLGGLLGSRKFSRQPWGQPFRRQLHVKRLRRVSVITPSCMAASPTAALHAAPTAAKRLKLRAVKRSSWQRTACTSCVMKPETPMKTKWTTCRHAEGDAGST